MDLAEKMNLNSVENAVEDIVELAEIISDNTSPSDVNALESVKPDTKKRISKTSLIIAILVSLSGMILMEIVTAIYKNLSEVNFGCKQIE